MIEYIVIAGCSASEMVKLVNDYCKDGWEPQGGVFVRNLNKFEVELFQAMIKRS